MTIYFQPKLEKILELLLYLAHVRPDSDIYQAVKFFYLADKLHLERHGRPISFDKYFALPYGPVASIAMDFLNKNPSILRDAGIEELPFETKYEKRGGRDVKVISKPTRDYDPRLFSKSDLRVFDEVVSEFGDKTFDELYNLTHGHDAYKEAWNNRRRTGQKASEMRYIEMIEDDDRRAEIIFDIGPVASSLE